jgi:mannose-6-phosphate isomerase-like protein (cupin superfamily)
MTVGKYLVRHREDVGQERGICGFRQRILTDADSKGLSLSILSVHDAQEHYHRETTEAYFVLEGEGVLHVDGERVEVRAGTMVLLPPGARHRAEGDFVTLIICAPAWLKEDQFLT